jgi:hypothetical protein
MATKDTEPQKDEIPIMNGFPICEFLCFVASRAIAA